MASDNILTARNIIKQYEDHLALNDVSISIPKGCIYGLLGPNGAGKSTLMKIINQITSPDSGEIFLEGEKLQRKHISKIGYLPEERGLYKKMKVGEQSLYLAQLKGMSKYEANKKLKYWFEKLNIHEWWDKKVEELSKGMAQKVQLFDKGALEGNLLLYNSRLFQLWIEAPLHGLQFPRYVDRIHLNPLGNNNFR